MRVFEHMNQETKEPCPICQTKADKPVVLVAKDDKAEEGNYTVEAIQVHVDCLELWINSSATIIYSRVPEHKKVER